MIQIIEIKNETIADFKTAWPCHGIADAVDFIVVAVNDGDLVDYQCEDADHNEVEPGEDSGAALSALFEMLIPALPKGIKVEVHIKI